MLASFNNEREENMRMSETPSLRERLNDIRCSTQSVGKATLEQLRATENKRLS